ncbi:MAG TPA: Ig-like domain-containing protein, partial [Gemmataceae bacterium]|nr:Ig-like domain-containing protein [Gemmataceae bacterium]
PGGRVALFYGGRVLGVATVSVVDGVATANFNIVFYANGNYTFGAEYIGTSQFAPSLSNPVNVLV